MSYSNIANASPCLSVDSLNCVDRVYYDFVERDLDADCLAQCPLECDSVDYSFTVSSSAYPSVYFYDLYKDRLPMVSSYDEFKESLATIKIYYPALSYTKLSELPKTSVVDLLSSIGGTLGLYIGISFLSLVEIVEILLES